MRTIAPRTQLAMTVYGRMLERNISISELATRVEVSYEMARKVAVGSQPPSKRLLKDVCFVLGLEFRKLDDLRKAEHIRRKHGSLPPSMTNKNPELQPIEDLWPQLGANEKEQIIDLVRYYAQRSLAQKGNQSSATRVRPQSDRSH